MVRVVNLDLEKYKAEESSSDGPGLDQPYAATRQLTAMWHTGLRSHGSPRACQNINQHTTLQQPKRKHNNVGKHTQRKLLYNA